MRQLKQDEKTISVKNANDDLENSLGADTPDASLASESFAPMKEMKLTTPTTEKEKYEVLEMTDKLIASIFSEMKVIDKSFSNVERFFGEMAVVYQNAAINKKGKIDINSVEGKMVLAATIGAFAVEGVKNIWKQLIQENELQRIMPILKREAITKGDALKNSIKLVEEMVTQDQQLFIDSLNTVYNRYDNVLNNSTDFFNKVKNPITERLEAFRNHLYTFWILLYLNRQFEAWSIGSYTNEAMPSFGDVNRFILYNLLYSQSKNNSDVLSKKQLAEANSRIMQDIGCLLGHGDYSDNIPSSIYPVALDKQLMAIFFASFENPFDERITDLIDKGQQCSYKSILKNFFLKNESYDKKYKSLAKEYSAIEGMMLFRLLVIIINALLLLVIPGIQLFRHFEGWTWPIVIEAGVVLLVWLIASKPMKNVVYLYEQKMEKLKLFTYNTMCRIAGDRSKQMTLGDIRNNSVKMFTYCVIGFIAGFFCIPIPGGAIIGALLAAFLVGSNKEEHQSDGSDYKLIKTGAGIMSYVTFVVLTVLLWYVW